MACRMMNIQKAESFYVEFRVASVVRLSRRNAVDWHVRLVFACAHLLHESWSSWHCLFRTTLYHANSFRRRPVPVSASSFSSPSIQYARDGGRFLTFFFVILLRTSTDTDCFVANNQNFNYRSSFLFQ